MGVMLQWACASCTRCGTGLGAMECVEQSEKQRRDAEKYSNLRHEGGHGPFL